MGIKRRPTPRKLPEKLRIIRDYFGLSQGEMVKALKIGKRYSRNSISGYERGEREPPLPVLLAYAKFSGVSTDILIDDKREILPGRHAKP